jgi:DNA-binding SARP family transcriptional activator/tetratricopeptide (TPR) repeat protein
VIHLHTLGVVDLRGQDGEELRGVLQQPKRLGLLAYLAVAWPRRFHRRDSLLALFWPELDQEHARAALRRALYFLRSELGSEVLVGRGDEEVRVAEQELWCDAAAMGQALDAGEPEKGLGLYRGVLLDGLYVAGAAPEFEEWLDRERRRLQTRAAEAPRAVSQRAEAEGRVLDAAGAARRALELNADDESDLRRLVALLDRSGDRSGAIRAYDEFTRRLAEEYQLEPSKETRAMVEAIRARVEPETVTLERLRAKRGEGQGAEAQGTIAVLPFAVRGDPRYGYLGEGIVDLLGTKLDGAGDVRIVDPRALLRFLTRGDQAGGEPWQLAEQFGAGRYLTGSILEAGGRLQVGASLYALDGSVLASVQAAAASEAGLFDLVDELARQILGAASAAAGTRLTRLAALTTHSLDALKGYLLGERELRAGRYFDAMDGFQKAVEADPSFALAYYRLAAAAAGCALPDFARETADRAFQHRDRLGPHDQLVLRAQRAWLHGAVSEAESLYNSITGTYPDDVEAWFHLGDLLFHSNPLRGRSATEARVPFERVVRFEPDHVGAMVHLVRICGIQGRKQEMLDLIERILRASPESDQALAMRALRAFTTNDPAGIAQVSEELQSARAITVAIAFSDVALYSGNLAGAEHLARSFIQVARSAELRALCHVQVAHVALAAGRREVADEELRKAIGLDETWGLETRAMFAALPFLPLSEGEVRSARDALAAWDPSRVPPSSFIVFAMHNGLHPAFRAYLLGLLELRLGNAAAALAQLNELSGLESQEGLVRSLVVELRARLVRAEGKAAEALALLERSRPELWFQLTVASPFFSLASQRFLRAELLEEVGRMEEAAGWYGAIAERSPYEVIYAAPARERIAAMAASSNR